MTRRVTIRHGKHRGNTFDEIADSDRDYCSWILRTPHLPTSLSCFASYLRSEYGGIVGVGRHRNKFYQEIFTEDPACPHVCTPCCLTKYQCSRANKIEVSHVRWVLRLGIYTS